MESLPSLILNTVLKGSHINEQLIRKLFLFHDYVPKSVYSLRNAEHNTRDDENLEKNVAYVTDTFGRFSDDVEATIKSFQPDDWDPDILADARQLLYHQHSYFFVDISEKLSRDIQLKKKRRDIESKPGSLDELDDLLKSLKEAKERAESVLNEFLGVFPNANVTTTDQNRLPLSAFEQEFVPASTFRQLLVQNVIKGLAKEIFSTIKMPGDNNEPALVKKTAEILKHNFRKLATLSIGDEELPWCSKAITVLAIPEHEILLTGETRRTTGDDSPKFLQRVSKEIATERLGSRFSKFINARTETFHNTTKDRKSHTGEPLSQKIVDAMADGEVEEFYEAAIVDTADSNKDLKDMSSTSPLFLWTFNGSSFELMPPCIRCQWLYRSWNIAGWPSTISEKKDSLKGIRGQKMEYNKGKKPPCTYCAETIVAAKAYLLYHGDLVLV
ncbi:hypothetical protein F5Y10DRAFT_249350 [Nemania abortiva]|nr:hypothetical protein F5Y10DRAFT_249350 [Nemania abortiva]